MGPHFAASQVTELQSCSSVRLQWLTHNLTGDTKVPNSLQSDLAGQRGTKKNAFQIRSGFKSTEKLAGDTIVLNWDKERQ